MIYGPSLSLFFFTQILFMSLLLLLSWSPCLSLLLSPSEVISVIITMYAISSEKPCVIPERKYEWGWMSVKSTLAQYWHASALACIPGGTYENMQSSTHREEHTCAVSNWINAQVEALPNASYCLSSIPWRMHRMNKTFVNKGIYWFKYNRE